MKSEPIDGASSETNCVTKRWAHIIASQATTASAGANFRNGGALPVIQPERAKRAGSSKVTSEEISLPSFSRTAAP